MVGIHGQDVQDVSDGSLLPVAQSRPAECEEQTVGANSTQEADLVVAKSHG